MKASKPGPKPSGKAKSAAQRMREYRARKAEEALGFCFCNFSIGFGC